METVEVNGLRLAYRRTGHGRTVMFVHGGAQDGRAWTPQLDALSDEFTAIAWDEPGAGRSEDIPDQFGLSDYADCTAEAPNRKYVGDITYLPLADGSNLYLAPRRDDSRARHLANIARRPIVGHNGDPRAVPTPPRGNPQHGAR